MSRQVTHPGQFSTGIQPLYLRPAPTTSDFVAAVRALGSTPHVAQNLKRRGGSAIDARTTRHPGYELSQCTRKRIEEPFGWGKTVGRIRQTVFRGLERVNLQLLLTMTANNLVRMRTLLTEVA
jgi:IS5 family transposase